MKISNKTELRLKGRNPDVLNSIANLSNDEVFTPPEFANQMLNQLEIAWERANGSSIWESPSTKFLDPFTKSGVFLREVVKRLLVGLEQQFPDLQNRIDHILTKQVFGIATTTLTALLARRSVYCSKDATGKHSITTQFTNPEGNVAFEPGQHHWGKGTVAVRSLDPSGQEVISYPDARCTYCGVTKREFDREEGLELHAYGFIHNTDINKWVKETFGEDMQFDVIIGNPPYQLDDGGYGTSAGPIYDQFVSQAKKLNPRYLSMVIPARWFSGGKGLDGFRDAMLSDSQLRVLHDFPDSSEVFPGVQIKGGVCFFLWEKGNTGPVAVTTHDKGQVISTATRPLIEAGADVFIRYNEAVAILKKVFAVEKDSSSDSVDLAFNSSQGFKALVSSSKPFGFRTFFQGETTSSPGSVKVFQNGGIGFTSRMSVSKNEELIDVWKVFIPRAGSGSDAFPHMILGKPFVGQPGEISTETYNCIGPFPDGEQAENARRYIQTKFFRFLVLMHKPSQDASQSVYTFVPRQDFSQMWDDARLFKKYGISPDEVDFINSLIREMELGDE
jgi:site-specific DNA-methyltransferase (adenine-specific)